MTFGVQQHVDLTPTNGQTHDNEPTPCHQPLPYFLRTQSYTPEHVKKRSREVVSFITYSFVEKQHYILLLELRKFDVVERVPYTKTRYFPEPNENLLRFYISYIVISRLLQIYLLRHLRPILCFNYFHWSNTGPSLLPVTEKTTLRTLSTQGIKSRETGRLVFSRRLPTIKS